MQLSIRGRTLLRTSLRLLKVMMRLAFCDYGCLCPVSRVKQQHMVSNSEIKHIVPDEEGKLINEVVRLHRLKWLRHVLCIPTYRLQQLILAGIGLLARNLGWSERNTASIHEAYVC
uniref:Uncharacterized protein n=1 Tax=Trichobilharzia regenti TaxID=157069 RepID=A0AA85JW69_TRIRE|nr:unnamed protein product [Trichobilharzia regenti]